jgi:prepilin-type N-terminal cleavage/methylation domain-containing protein
VRQRRRSQSGFTILEVLVALVLLSVVAVANGAVIRALGMLGVVQSFAGRDDLPARLRTVAMEYAQAELEYLKNWSYDYHRDSAACNPSAGLPVPFTSARRVPGAYLGVDEPRLPQLLATADIVVASEPVNNPRAAPFDCRPRRIVVRVYLHAQDAPATPGGLGGVVFLESIAVRALR